MLYGAIRCRGLSCENHVAVGTVTVAVKLELPGWDDPKTNVLGLVSRWLSDAGNSRWPMILDNADDINVFHQI